MMIGGTLWVSDGCDIHVVYSYVTTEDGAFTATPAYETLTGCCGIDSATACADGFVQFGRKCSVSCPPGTFYDIDDNQCKYITFHANR